MFKFSFAYQFLNGVYAWLDYLIRDCWPEQAAFRLSENSYLFVDNEAYHMNYIIKIFITLVRAFLSAPKTADTERRK